MLLLLLLLLLLLWQKARSRAQTCTGRRQGGRSGSRTSKGRLGKKRETEARLDTTRNEGNVEGRRQEGVKCRVAEGDGKLREGRRGRPEGRMMERVKNKRRRGQTHEGMREGSRRQEMARCKMRQDKAR